MSIIQTKKKFLLVSLFILVGVVTLFWGTFQKTSSNDYCSSCHMMKPEFFTWQASSHSQVACVACHVEPGVKSKVKYKLFNVKEWIAALTGNYGIVITSTTPISDVACAQCHDMNTRKLTPSGDLIIPHDKHMQKGVSCTSCHTGIAHGNIVKKRVTFRTDYAKWDDTIGKSIMSDVKNLRPDMDVCMNCHKVRKAPLDCSACHSTSMTPENHKKEAFKNGAHGELAAKDIQACDFCHAYMSKEKVEVTKGSENKYLQYLSKDIGKPTTILVSDYAKTNTYCKDCHGKLPPSHRVNLFEMNHGILASQNEDKCFTCHDNRVMGNSPVTNLACGTCHPSTHYKRPWRETHPVPLTAKPQITEFCYTCHVEETCGSCHSLAKK